MCKRLVGYYGKYNGLSTLVNVLGRRVKAKFNFTAVNKVNLCVKYHMHSQDFYCGDSVIGGVSFLHLHPLHPCLRLWYTTYKQITQIPVWAHTWVGPRPRSQRSGAFCQIII